MKRRWIRASLTLMIVTLLATAASAQSRGTGLGLILGEPTGLSAKIWMGRSTAFNAAAAWSFTDENSLHLHGDIVAHSFGIFDDEVESGDLALYWGLGGRVKLYDGDSRAGVRIPIGINYIFGRSAADVFLEVVPIVDVAPATEGRLNAALGARWFFR